MNKEACAFSKNHRCPIWIDYNVTLCSLEEAKELCRGNWIEIERFRRWTDALTSLLNAHGINYLSEWDIDETSRDESSSET